MTSTHVLAIDTEKLQITVRPGIRIQQLSAILRESGMSLMDQGDIDSQAIAAAVMTGTHGAGRRLACMATQIVALRIVTSTGAILDLSADSEPELFRAGRVSIGTFGLVVSLTIQAVSSYNILKRPTRLISGIELIWANGELDGFVSQIVDKTTSSR